MDVDEAETLLATALARARAEGVREGVERAALTNPMIQAVLHHCQADGTLDRSYICDCLNAALADSPAPQRDWD